jgi:hypothetical protein
MAGFRCAGQERERSLELSMLGERFEPSLEQREIVIFTEELAEGFCLVATGLDRLRPKRLEKLELVLVAFHPRSKTVEPPLARLREGTGEIPSATRVSSTEAWGNRCPAPAVEPEPLGAVAERTEAILDVREGRGGIPLCFWCGAPNSTPKRRNVVSEATAVVRAGGMDERLKACIERRFVTKSRKRAAEVTEGRVFPRERCMSESAAVKPE